MTESTAKKYQLRCHDCGLETDETITCTLCKRCGGVLEVEMDFDFLKERIQSGNFKVRAINALKYLDFYPLGGSVKVSSLGEGSTPLIKMERINKELGIDNVFVKNEGVNPTGVFKDRGSLVEIAKARQLGEEAIVVASSGNMAASCAAYAAKSGIKCYVLIPAQTPVGKLAQIISYGAEVIKVKGEYSDCVRFARRLSEDHKMYLAGDYVFRREGQKSLAYELCEQFEYKVPSVVVCPTGAGTNLAAIWKGFKEFYQLGFIKSLPKMVAVQAEGASPLAEAFKIGKKSYIEWKKLRRFVRQWRWLIQRMENWHWKRFMILAVVL
ncbi:threonine synthase [Candidatus Gracilibacteria bacterium]|nr:threonine synthase [Candidatus Gracilibacteria bacterium]